MMRTLVCTAVLFGAALAPVAASAAIEPKDLVRALYSESSVSVPAGRSASYFAEDLDGALHARGASALRGFDYRYVPGELRISDLDILQQIDNDQARVVAVFKNYGRANSVDWTMCRRADGSWRIADASSNSGDTPWDLRRLLSLSDQIQC